MKCSNTLTKIKNKMPENAHLPKKIGKSRKNAHHMGLLGFLNLKSEFSPPLPSLRPIILPLVKKLQSSPLSLGPVEVKII